jgi:hypothetical protein
MLEHGHGGQILGQDEAAQARRCGVGRQEQGDRHDDRDQHRPEGLGRRRGQRPRAIEQDHGADPERQQGREPARYGAVPWGR